MSRWAETLATICCCVACGLSAAEQSALPSGAKLQALLVRMRANMNRNALLAEQYTSLEEWRNLNWNEKGKKVIDESARYENVFVEGLPYRRMVAQNGKPLTGKAAAKEEQRYEKAVEERKHMTLDQKRGFFHLTLHSDMPLCCLATLFDNRITGEQLVDGRETLVVESTPKPGAKPDAAEMTALNWRETTWIDVQDDMPVRTIAVALKDMKLLRKGFTFRLDWERVLPPPDERNGQPAWLEKHFSGQGWSKILLMNRRVDTEETYSDYKKFQVDVRFLDNTVKPAPPNGH